MTTQRAYTHAVIVGAGFAGIAIACRFKKDLGLNDFAIFEKSDFLGGTWHLNTCE